MANTNRFGMKRIAIQVDPQRRSSWQQDSLPNCWSSSCRRGAVLFWSDVRWVMISVGSRLVELLGRLYLLDLFQVFGFLFFLFLINLLNLGHRLSSSSSSSSSTSYKDDYWPPHMMHILDIPFLLPWLRWVELGMRRIPSASSKFLSSSSPQGIPTGLLWGIDAV